MIFMNSVDTLLKIILYQFFSSSRCIFFINDKNSNSINLPVGSQVVNIALDSSDNSTSISNKLFKNYGCQIFIINVDNPALVFANIEQGLKLQNETFTERKYIVVNNFNSTEPILKIFKTPEINFISNMLVVGLKTQSLGKNISLLEKYEEVYYLRTHKYIGLKENNDIYELDQWFSVNESFLKNSNLFPDKLTNQYGRGCKIGFFEYEPYLIYDKKDQRNIAGLEGTIISTFLKRHNITLKPHFIYKDYWGDVFDNGTVYGLRGALYQDKIDIGVAAFFATDRMYRFYGMSSPILRLGITCLVPAPKPIAGWLVPMFVYSTLMWKLVFINYIMIVLFVYGTEVGFMLETIKYLRTNKYILLIKKFGEIVFVIFTQYFNDGNLLKRYSGKIFVIMTLVVTFFLCRSYESGLASIMTIPRYQSSINTADDFYQSNMPWGGLQIGDYAMHWKDDKDERYRRAYRRYFAASSEAQLKERLLAGNFGILIERIPGGYFHMPNFPLDVYKDVKIMKEDIHWEYSVFLLRKSSPLIPSINNFLHQVKESGIQSVWLKEAVHLVSKQTTQKAISHLQGNSHQERSLVILTLGHVAGIFGILLIGNVIALLIFCLEVFYFSKCNCNSRL